MSLLPETEELTLPELRAEAKTCTRCPLYKNATQTVFGEGAVQGEGAHDGTVGGAGKKLELVLNLEKFSRRRPPGLKAALNQ